MFFERVAVAGTVAHGSSVVVDGLRRIEQQGGYARAVLNAHADEGEDAQLGVELLAFRGEDFLAGAQQGIEFGHKTGVEREKSRVEVDEEAFGIGFVHLRVVLLEQVVGLFGFNFTLDQLLVSVELVNIGRAEVEEEADVLLAGAVGLQQLVVELAQTVVELVELALAATHTSELPGG